MPQYVAPGWTCVWRSTRPGVTSLPRTSTTSRAPARGRSAPTAAIRPPRTATSRPPTWPPPTSMSSPPASNTSQFTGVLDGGADPEPVQPGRATLAVQLGAALLGHQARLAELADQAAPAGVGDAERGGQVAGRDWAAL